MATRHWHARLDLGFAREHSGTRLLECRHSGPLRVQKALYPEGAGICHAVIVHPPGGVVGGDQLEIAVKLGAGAHAVLSTPGAGKWYKANCQRSQQSVTLDLAPAASLEWLPQESIFFDAAQVQLQQTIRLGKDASYIGWEIFCFGRTASGERFASGQVRQHTRIWREGQLIWFEQGGVAAALAQENREREGHDGKAGDEGNEGNEGNERAGGAPTGAASALHNPLGLRGYTVCATLLAVGKNLNTAQLNAIRDAASRVQEEWQAAAPRAPNAPTAALPAMPGQAAVATDSAGQLAAGEFGISQGKTVLVARYLGHSSELARQLMLETWRHVRPAMLGCAAQVPRIWQI